MTTPGEQRPAMEC